MKEHLRTIIENFTDPVHKQNIMREYIQARVLAILQNEGAMIPLAFHGGTALRFLYQLPRFSEDLDFALEKPDSPYDFLHMMKAVKNSLMKQGYKTNIKINDQKTVHSAFIKIEELLYEYNLSVHRDENFSIKIEVDTKPPLGAVMKTRVVKRYIPLHVQHHDQSSLLAGKLHSIIHRPWVKGRDFYDLVWYLSDPEWPEPNFTMLNNALKQTGWEGDTISSMNWRTAVSKRIDALDMGKIIEDVKPFLENRSEVQLLKKENILRLLARG